MLLDAANTCKVRFILNHPISSSGHVLRMTIPSRFSLLLNLSYLPPGARHTQCRVLKVSDFGMSTALTDDVDSDYADYVRVCALIPLPQSRVDI